MVKIATSSFLLQDREKGFRKKGSRKRVYGKEFPDVQEELSRMGSLEGFPERVTAKGFPEHMMNRLKSKTGLFAPLIW